MFISCPTLFHRTDLAAGGPPAAPARQPTSRSACRAAAATVFRCASWPRQPDRKTVVWGKSVSVRVDLGGRRSIKKHKNRIELRRMLEIYINNIKSIDTNY